MEDDEVKIVHVRKRKRATSIPWKGFNPVPRQRPHPRPKEESEEEEAAAETGREGQEGKRGVYESADEKEMLPATTRSTRFFSRDGGALLQRWQPRGCNVADISLSLLIHQLTSLGSRRKPASLWRRLAALLLQRQLEERGAPTPQRPHSSLPHTCQQPKAAMAGPGCSSPSRAFQMS